MPATDMLIDAHTHIHPTAEHGTAFLRLIKFDVPWDGSIDEGAQLMERTGTTTSVIVALMAAKRIFEQRLEETQERGLADPEAIKGRVAAEWSQLNSWAARAARESNGRFAALVGLDPVLLGAEWARKEIDMNLKAGAIGLKINPGGVGAYPGDERMAVVWEEASRRGLAVLSLPQPTATPVAILPKHYEEVLRSYPRCRIVFPHMAMHLHGELVRMANKYPNLYCDTSFWIHRLGTPGHLSLSEAADLFRRVGIDRVMYGTNYPLCDPTECARVFREVPLTEQERRLVSWENFVKVYGPVSGSPAPRLPAAGPRPAAKGSR